MIKNDIREIYTNQNKKDMLEDIYKTISISVSLANGMVWKEKTKSFYKTIAREIKDVLDNDLLEDINLKSFKNKYLRINIEDNSLIFLKNDIIDELSEGLNQKDWLNQRLVIIENPELPLYLTSKEKEEMFKGLTDEERDILNENYSRQELNSDKFAQSLNEEDKAKVLEILNKFNYFDVTVEEYLNLVSDGSYEYRTNSHSKNIKIFKNTFNNYVLELGAYIASEIEKYLN